MKIPFIYVDPMLPIFKEQVGSCSSRVTPFEKQKFIQYTSELRQFFERVEPYDCTAQCQNPALELTGKPVLKIPKSINAQFKTSTPVVQNVIEWNIFRWNSSATFDKDNTKLFINDTWNDAWKFDGNFRKDRNTGIKFKLEVTVHFSRSIDEIRLYLDPSDLQEDANKAQTFQVENLEGKSDQAVVITWIN